ncbi:ABC transporter ATP-binding protein [Noviherbaspirillum suwonense]|jgi:branched-chain amino acid transport system ATP-binding protein|uniref:Amino acid/amide ABC transporter ATP-binding protein 2, HAAT family n=1 Tax=Noviherbaspirillum suwonense TaxID=1224511 RepID=A0ABY1QLY2_9BURK|nr:ABC transporter ATP-binding protein [Noviherbaspirillum suwonense]SMP75174.1 amino acid/amide ABC transporter ATP-binding protein 2, HAAT family [Noviherbaspirillum suwonense]
MSAESGTLLSIDGLHAHYGKSHILHGVSFRVARNEVISLLGRNGSGRSTTMKAIMGLVPPSAGSIRLQDRELAGARPYAICRAGVAFVPEERETFANLTVDENLRMGEQPAVHGAYRWSTEQMFDYFPRLKERRNTKAGSLSGGEQQMLTICRSLLGNPLVILIDEPTEGLAPKIVAQVGECIRDMHAKGVSVVLVEQKLAIALKVSTRVCVMGHGRIVYEGTPQELAANEKLLAEWLAV